MYRIDTPGTRGLIYFCKCNATSDWIKVEKKANNRNRYGEVPHLTRDTIWESDKNTRKCHKQESQEVSHFTAGDHKTARNRQDSIKKTSMNINDKKRIGSMRMFGIHYHHVAHFFIGLNVVILS